MGELILAPRCEHCKNMLELDMKTMTQVYNAVQWFKEQEPIKDIVLDEDDDVDSFKKTVDEVKTKWG